MAKPCWVTFGMQSILDVNPARRPHVSDPALSREPRSHTRLVSVVEERRTSHGERERGAGEGTRVETPGCGVKRMARVGKEGMGRGAGKRQGNVEGRGEPVRVESRQQTAGDPVQMVSGVTQARDMHPQARLTFMNRAQRRSSRCTAALIPTLLRAMTAATTSSFLVGRFRFEPRC